MRVRTRALRAAGIRRCGVRHTAEPQVWPAGQFTEDQIRILQAEPLLVVELLDDGDQGGSENAASRAPAKDGGTPADAGRAAKSPAGERKQPSKKAAGGKSAKAAKKPASPKAAESEETGEAQPAVTDTSGAAAGAEPDAGASGEK